MEKIQLVPKLREELRDQYWATGDAQYKQLGDLLDTTLAIIDRLAAGDYSGS